MTTVRRGGYTKAELEEQFKKGKERGKEETLSNLEAVMAGKKPKVLTRADVAAMSPADINANWDQVCDVLAQEEAETPEEDE